MDVYTDAYECTKKESFLRFVDKVSRRACSSRVVRFSLPSIEFEFEIEVDIDSNPVNALRRGRERGCRLARSNNTRQPLARSSKRARERESVRGRRREIHREKQKEKREQRTQRARARARAHLFAGIDREGWGRVGWLKDHG